MPVRIALYLIIACGIQFGWIMTAQAAINFDELLKQTRNIRADEAKQAAQRLTNFRNQLASQERKVNEASAKRNAAEATSNALSKQFDANEARIKELRLLLEQHQGNLGELFGVTRQIAGDAANVLQDSLISVQFPAAEGEEDRVTFLRREAGAKELPSISELERIWFELQREMTESGKVVRVTTDILQMDNSSTQKAEVVRIGSFTAVGGEDYFTYLPSRQMLAALSGKIDGRLQNIAGELTSQTSGDKYLPAVVDPASGALLSMYVQRPDWRDRIRTGHLVGFIIIGVGIIGAIVALIQYVYLFITQFMVARQLKDRNHPTANNPLGRLLLAIKNNATANDSSDVIELRISEAVLREVPKLERFQAFLRLAVAAGPLLGLIGTVIGMIITFQTITASGASDPKLMANGIGQAMIATVLGLGIAIPLLFVNAGLASLSRGLVQVLDENSTGLLADRIRSKRK